METNVEANILQLVFPEEIWLLVAKKQDIIDFKRLSDSSTYLHILFKYLRLQKLFPEVAKFLCGKNDNFQNVNGRISPDFLNCRLVCRSWQIGIDCALQRSSNYYKLLDTDGLSSFPVRPKSTDTHFRQQEKPSAFLRRFNENYASQNRNPFIGRSVFIYYSPEITDRVSFDSQLRQIVTMYGHHVWHFSFMLAINDHFEAPNISFFQLLRDCLQLMPNLKMLRFSYLGFSTTDHSIALGLSIQSCIFPELQNLRHLHMSNVPTPVFDALLRRYSHVAMLSTWYYVPRKMDLLMYTHPMPNLTQVAFSFTEWKKLDQFGDLDALWPLKTLVICINFFQLDWSQLFQFLENRWATTLTELKIDIKIHQPVPVLPSLKLPNLKVFMFETGTFVSLDFILPMRNSLRRLVVRYTRSPVLGHQIGGPEREGLESEFENERVVQLYKFRRNLRESNIWMLFPKLDIVEYYDGEIGEQYCCRPILIA